MVLMILFHKFLFILIAPKLKNTHEYWIFPLWANLPTKPASKRQMQFCPFGAGFLSLGKKASKGSTENKNRRQPLDDGGSAENNNTANYDILDFVFCSFSQILRDHHNKAASNQYHYSQRDQKRGHCRRQIVHCISEICPKVSHFILPSTLSN